MPIDGSGTYTRSNGTYSGTTLWQQRAGQPNPKIDAAEHDAEMNDVADAISLCLKANGSKTPTANLPMGNFKHTGCANATNNDEYATLGQINSIVPVASITGYAGGAAPTGWLLCDGSAVSRTTYASLFAIIGTTYGAGDGSTTFNVPELRQRFPLGKAASGTGSTLGSTGGSIDHTHTGPLHQHDLQNHQHDLSNHTHTMSHTHGAGSLRALVGTENTSVQKISFLLDPAVTFGKTSGATYPGTHQTVAFPGYTYATGVDAAVAVPTSYVLGNTGSESNPNTGAPSSNITGLPNNNLTSFSGNGNTGAANPPYLVINFIIKY